MPARGATSASAAAAYSGAPAPRSIADTTSIMGIPETELTPKVKEAIFTLMEEVDKLRHSVEGLNRRLAEAEQAADQDVLLPIYNRRAFVRELTRVQATVERYNSPGSLVYIDLNGFKDINDKYGHQAGDAVLAEFSARLIHSVRETDIIGRLGGDEFGLILSRTNQESATFLTARLTRELEERPILWQGEAVQVGMAYGIVPIEPGKNAEQALSDADSKMYAHKRQDR
ncbi:GGDEF domain-containing protein [Sneathiella chinensis]|uniref:diguanylate cyclase n=2 Tax=Sneathiella chinensis TaxID=349750 RepID=A0ABQ5U7T1_9PROT|nr:GGDEF domain-containing protein [Sneathiella chinensis]GLQ06521.1 GGDEF domain-containing protein [Sneathiella chinensis]